MSGRVLLIDDDEAFRRVVRLMLTTAAGYEVQEAASGSTGLACYREQHSDVVLTDILMHDGEGLETIRALKRLDPDVRIIAMSSGGAGPHGYLQMAVTFGARRSLQKPFSQQELLWAISEVLAD